MLGVAYHKPLREGGGFHFVICSTQNYHFLTWSLRDRKRCIPVCTNHKISSSLGLRETEMALLDQNKDNLLHYFLSYFFTFGCLNGMDCILLSGLRTRPGSAVQAARIAAVFPYSEPFATAIRFVIGKKLRI